MRISDWSSDVLLFRSSPTKPTSATWIIRASSSLLMATIALLPFMPAKCWIAPEMPTDTTTFSVATPFSFRQIASSLDRQSVVSGTSVYVRVDLGGRRIIKKKTYNEYHYNLKINL